jgi:hypothetical protein
MRANVKSRKRPAKRGRTKRTRPEIELPPHSDWRTTDVDEINRRRLRARDEQPRIRNLDPRQPIFSNFEVRSRSGMTYHVEIRDLANRTRKRGKRCWAPYPWWGKPWPSRIVCPSHGTRTKR